jgi:hypothetical protein
VPELSQLVDNAALTPQTTVDAPLGGVTVDPFTCTGAVQPGVDTVYDGSGSTGFAGQVLSDASQDHKVIQSIASFPSETEAKAFFDKQVAGWQARKFTDVSVTIGGSTSPGTVAVAANTEGTGNVFIFPPAGGPGRQCEHVMTPRKNVVDDVRVCAPNVGSMGWTLARDIGQKITGQRESRRSPLGPDRGRRLPSGGNGVRRPRAAAGRGRSNWDGACTGRAGPSGSPCFRSPGGVIRSRRWPWAVCGSVSRSGTRVWSRRICGSAVASSTS